MCWILLLKAISPLAIYGIKSTLINSTILIQTGSVANEMSTRDGTTILLTSSSFFERDQYPRWKAPNHSG